jgi:hypothetical protein
MVENKCISYQLEHNFYISKRVLGFVKRNAHCVASRPNRRIGAKESAFWLILEVILNDECDWATGRQQPN